METTFGSYIQTETTLSVVWPQVGGDSAAQLDVFIVGNGRNGVFRMQCIGNPRPLQAVAGR